MRNLKRSILLTLGGASLVGAGPVLADTTEVEVNGERWTLGTEITSYSENPDLLEDQPWWGDPDLALELAETVEYDLGLAFEGEGGGPGALFAYGLSGEYPDREGNYYNGENGEPGPTEGDGSLEVGNGEVRNGEITDPETGEFVAITFWENGDVYDCPRGCPRVEDPYRYAILKSVQRMMSLASVSESLESSSRAVGAALSTSTLHVHGAHGRPMSRYVDEGESTVWVLGDYGVRRHGDQDGNTGIAGVGAGHNFGLMQFNYSLGRTWTEEDLVQGGEVDTDTFFLMLEGIVPVHEEAGLFLTVGGFHQWGEADIRRGYLNSGGQRDFSTASPSMHGQGARVRMDWVDAWSASRVSLSPYADLSYSRIRMEGYEESGGDLPARFSSRSDSVTELRVGSELAMPIADSGFDFVATGNVTHRFDSDGVRTRGRMLNDPFTVNEFNIDGRDYDQTWVRAGVGVEGAVGPGDASVMLNGTTRGEEEAGWLAASYSVTF